MAYERLVLTSGVEGDRKRYTIALRCIVPDDAKNSLENMLSVSNPIALAALNKALKNIRSGPKRRPKYDSRTADKFVIRGFVELFEELKGIGLHQGRSMNSEAIAAILDALDGHVRSTMQVKILKAHLGDGVSERVMAQVPDFDLSACSTPDTFVVRLPPTVRDVIRDGVKRATSGGGEFTTMKDWVLDALVSWINIQRQEYALLTAAIAMEPGVLIRQH